MAPSGYGTSGTYPLPNLLALGLFFIYCFRSTQVHRTYDNGAPGNFIIVLLFDHANVHMLSQRCLRPS